MKTKPSSNTRRGLPLLGSFPEFRRDPLEFCVRLAREHGDLAFFRLGWLRCVQVNRPEWIQQLLTKEAKRLHKSADFTDLKSILGNGLLTSEDELWRRQRRLIQPAFHNDRIRRYASTMLSCAATSLEHWQATQAGAEIDLSAELSRVTLEIVGRTLFGADMLSDAERVAHALGVYLNRFEEMLTGLPLPIAWPLPNNLPAHRAARTLNAVVTRLVRERRARSDPHADDLLSYLLAAQDEQGGINERQVRDELVTFMLAGHETTALALTWALVFVAQDAAVERRLVAELDDVLAGRSLTVGDEFRLTYVRQVIEEAIRLRPPVWSTGREALEDIDLDGQRITKGMQILFAPWVTHRDPRYFADPERFDPDRFSAERRASIPRFAYFPFGGGPRVCVGMHFAMMEATLLLAAILQRFRVELVPGQHIVLQPSVTLRPKSGIRVRMRPRAPQTSAASAASFSAGPQLD